MVDEYDYAFPELNEERIYDNPSESTDHKMILYDNVHDPAMLAQGREVVYDYPIYVGSGEDEIAARRVEMTPNPAYGTVAGST